MISENLIVGLPGSGKTTFIAALRYLLVSKETETVLNLVRLSEEEAHLNALEDKWLACEAIGRTLPTQATEWVSFFVTGESAHETELVLPDLSGEAFRTPAATGMCKQSLLRVLQKVDGLLLFTNADKGVDDLLVQDVKELFGSEDDKAKPSAFVPEDMPEEALLVELLQIANRAPAPSRRRKVALVVSAWDVVENGAVPDEWIRKHRPMLWQFLRFNSDLWDRKVFGVSAQGGALPERKDELQRVEKPSHRIKVRVGGAPDTHDLTIPIVWLMSDEFGE